MVRRVLLLNGFAVVLSAGSMATAFRKQQARGQKPVRQWDAAATNRLAAAWATEIPALLAKGADPNVRDARGCPIIVAVAKQDCFRLWGDEEAFYSSQKRDQANNVRAARALLAAGANPNLRDNTNRTALDYARSPWEGNDLELARLLVRYGGKSPMWGENVPKEDSLWAAPLPR